MINKKRPETGSRHYFDTNFITQNVSKILKDVFFIKISKNLVL